MNTKYISPSIVVVVLQHQGLLCESIQSLGGNGNMSLGGTDQDYSDGGGVIRTKESTNVWDEEW